MLALDGLLPGIMLFGGVVLVVGFGIFTHHRLRSTENRLRITEQAMASRQEPAFGQNQRLITYDASGSNSKLETLQAALDKALETNKTLFEKATLLDMQNRSLTEKLAAVPPLNNDIVQQLADSKARVADLERAIETQLTMMKQAGSRILAQEQQIDTLRTQR